MWADLDQLLVRYAFSGERISGGVGPSIPAGCSDLVYLLYTATCISRKEMRGHKNNPVPPGVIW